MAITHVRCVFLGLVASLFMYLAVLRNIHSPATYVEQLAIPSPNEAADLIVPEVSGNFRESRQIAHLVHYPPTIELSNVDCLGIFHGHKASIKSAKRYQNENEFRPLPDHQFIKLTADCNKFINSGGYVMKPVSDEEANFSISYTIMAYTQVEQVERLLRAIYRPQNYYCVHVDAKVANEIKDGLLAISACFTNVRLSSRSLDVSWGSWNVLESELVCMEDLLKYPNWKYHINLAAQDFPLKSNWEIVNILKAFNGSNMIEGSKNRLHRHSYRFSYRYSSNGTRIGKKDPPPVDVTMNRGSFLIVARRGFVQYAVYNRTALLLQEYLKDTLIPDETYFSTLNHSPQLGIVGSYKGEASTGENYPFLGHYVIWEGGVCHGQFIREVCVFSIGDLAKMYNTPELFANKFHLREDPVAYMCMEQLHYNKTRDELAGRQKLNTTYYKQFELTWNHV